VNFEKPQHWSIDALSIANRGLGGLCDPEQVAQGYVVGNKLVVTMGALSIHPFVRFGGSGVIVGDIQNDAGQRRLVNVIVAGRWNAEDALRSFGRYETDLLGGGSGAAPICQQPEFRQTLAELQSLLCAARDTTSSPGQDGRDLPCTDVSTVVLLDTAPAELGPTVAASSAPSIDCPTELVTCP
jgi:hypothetical protein